MYAVVKTSGRQIRVSTGDHVQVDRIDAEVGTETSLDDVLMVGDGDDVKIGDPTVKGAKVKAKVLSHELGDKVITYKYKRRKRSRKIRGFRHSHTTLEIMAIEA
jgi:large subunit ribosomal protein L21